MRTKNLLFVLPLILFLAGAVFGSVPTKISYEGRLVDSSGNAITTAKTVSFSIYDAASAGSAVWGPESQSVTPDSQGVFSVVLGNTTAIASTVFNSPTRYLEITVGGETLSPRTQLVSVGYAFMAATAQTLEGGAVNKIVAGSGVGVSGDGTGTVTLTATGTGGGTVSQVSTGTGLTGGPVTTTGTISLVVPVTEARGGTNQTTYTTGDILYASGSNTLSKLSVGSTGQILKVSGGVPTWGSAGGTGTVTQVDTGTGLTGGPITGTGTISVDSTVATLTGTQTLTNKTISGASNTISNLSAGAISSGTFAEARGGTNQSTYATGDILYASGANTLAKLSAGSTGQILKISGGVPTWGSAGGTGTVTQVDSGTGLTGGPITSTGTLAVNVGTGANQIVQLDASSKLPAVDGSALTGLNAAHISSGTLATARLGSGTASSSTFLRGDQTWATPGGGGTLTQVDTGSGLTGGPITGTGTISVDSTVATLTGTQTLTNKTISGASNTISNLSAAAISSGTFAEARGGTNQSTYTTGDILYASGSNTLAKLAAGSNGEVLKVSGGVPVWGSGGGTGTVTQVNTGTGLTGGPITGTGTISVDSTIATLTGTQTLTNKTISDASNTITLSASTIPSLDASKVTSGTMVTARLGSGTASSTTFLRGDQTWATPGGGGTVTQVDSGTGLTGGPITGTGTLSVNVGTAANQIVQLDASSKLPAVDGSALTGLNASNIASGTLSDARFSTNVVTLDATQTLTNKTMSTGSTWNGNKVAEAYGGTNQSTYTTGDILYASGSNTLAKLAAGSNGEVLKVSGGVPVWGSGGGTGTVTQVNTGTGLTGGPITGSGTISIDATVATLSGTQTLTNKTISGSSNTLSNIADTSLNTISTAGKVSGGAITSGTIGGSTAINTTGVITAAAFSFSGGGSGVDTNSVQTLSNKTFSGTTTMGAVTATSFSGDGSALTSLNASNISSGTLSDSRLSANVTVQGNTFNGASQLVKLDASSKLPAVDGSALTNISATNANYATLAGTATTAATANGLNTSNYYTVAGLNVTNTATAAAFSGSGAGLTSLNAANLSSGTVATARLGSGTASSGTFLRGDQTWAAGNSGTVTQVNSGAGLTGGPITGTGTLAVNVGTGANQIVQLDASSKLPSVDGSALTGLTKTQVGLGNVENTALSTWAGSTNLTTLGTITTGTVPVARVSGLANSATVDATNASNISSGTLGTARLGSGTASSSTFLRGDQTWAAGNSGTVTQVSTGTGLTGGPVTATGTISVDTTVVATLTGAQSLSNKTFTGTTTMAAVSVSGNIYNKRFTASTSIDWNNGNVQSLTLANGANSLTFANGQDGGKYILILKQPASGAAGTVSWPASARWPGGTAVTLTATNAKTDYVGFIYNGVDSKYDGVAFTANL